MLSKPKGYGQATRLLRDLHVIARREDDITAFTACASCGHSTRSARRSWNGSTRQDCSGAEFGAVAYGHPAEEAAAALVGHVRAWDARGRALPQDAFTYWPDGTTLPLPDRLLSVFRKRHGIATVTWPPERTGDQAGS